MLACAMLGATGRIGAGNLDMSEGREAVAHKWCPKCGKVLEPGAVLCTRCGRHLATGGRARTVVDARRVDRGPRAMLMAGAAAASGGAAWGVIAVWLNVLAAYAAWPVGVLAGLGARLSTRERSQRLGLAAVGAALLGIVLAKVIAVYGVDPVVDAGDAARGDQLRRAEVRRLLAAGEINAGEAEPFLDEEARVEAGRVEQHKALWSRVEKQVGELSGSEAGRLLREHGDRAAARPGFIERLGYQLSPWDSVWSALGFVSAWLLARGVGRPREG